MVRLKKRVLTFVWGIAFAAFCLLQLRVALKNETSTLSSENSATVSNLQQKPAAWRSGNITWTTNFHGVPIPPRESLITTVGNITGDVQFLVDYVIAGFSKCGTSSLSSWFRAHPQIQAPNEERYDLIRHQPESLVKRMYKLYKRQATGSNYIQGYKQPKDVTFPQTIEYLTQYWPQTKLVITTRHPILWFESFWNFFRIELKRNNPGVGDMIGRKFPLRIYGEGLYTGLGEFHLYLSHLGKTRQTEDPDEWALLRDFYLPDDIHMAPFPRSPHKVFFMEVSQLADKNETRSKKLRADLQSFLGLQQPFPPVVHVRPLSKDANKFALNQFRMNICESQHKALRTELLRIARSASVWIRRYFLDAPDVYLSSRDFLEASLETWMHDPCENRTTTAKS